MTTKPTYAGRPAIEVEHNDGLPMLRRADFSDRYKIRLRIGQKFVHLYFLPAHLAELTKVDLTPEAPNSPMRVIDGQEFWDETAELLVKGEED